jgi:hypothetical protein
MHRETLIDPRFPRHEDVPPFSAAASRKKTKESGNRVFRLRLMSGQDGQQFSAS